MSCTHLTEIRNLEMELSEAQAEIEQLKRTNKGLHDALNLCKRRITMLTNNLTQLGQDVQEHWD